MADGGPVSGEEEDGGWKMGFAVRRSPALSECRRGKPFFERAGRVGDFGSSIGDGFSLQEIWQRTFRGGPEFRLA